jgi:hypothetical protein
MKGAGRISDSAALHICQSRVGCEESARRRQLASLAVLYALMRFTSFAASYERRQVSSAGDGTKGSKREIRAGTLTVVTCHMISSSISPYSWAKTFRWAMIFRHGISGCVRAGVRSCILIWLMSVEVGKGEVKKQDLTPNSHVEVKPTLAPLGKADASSRCSMLSAEQCNETLHCV